MINANKGNEIFDLTNFDSKLLRNPEDETATSADNRQSIWAGGGGCIQPTKHIVVMPYDPPISMDPIETGGGIDFRDKYERDERFEQPTTIMDRLVDAFGIDDTRIYGQDGKIVVDAGMGNDEVNVTKARDGGVNVEVNGKKYHFNAEQAKHLEIRGGSGDDTIKIADNVKVGVTIRGGSGDDTIKGGAGKDFISGGSGNDTIDGGRGDDWIHGGSGDDQIKGGRGNDTIYGGSGNDEVAGGRGDDYIHGGLGRDVLRGERGDDHIVRERRDQAVTGGSGDDEISYQDRFRLPLRPFRPTDLYTKLRG